jgi:Tol biopolymer transport system component
MTYVTNKRLSFVNLIAAFLWIFCCPAEAATQLVSVSVSGTVANDGSFYTAISADGRHVAFCSHATNLVAGDTNRSLDVFVRDRRSGRTERASVGARGVQANGGSCGPSISADGRYVAFHSVATNIVTGKTNTNLDIFVRDRSLGTTQRVSISSSGAQANDDSSSPVISANGRFVAFGSSATNLVGGDTNGAEDVFLFDRQTSTLSRVSVGARGAQANGPSNSPLLSSDGQLVFFGSTASNLAAGDRNGTQSDVFVRDRANGTTTILSLSSTGAGGNDLAVPTSVTPDGRFVAFVSFASNMVPNDTNGSGDSFIRDRRLNKLYRVSLGPGFAQINRGGFAPSISADGRFVAFKSQSTNLLPGDTSGTQHIYVRDRQNQTVRRVSVGPGGVVGNSFSDDPVISSNGSIVAFYSTASNLVANDTNVRDDIFVSVP